MEFTAHRDILLTALNRAKGAVEKKTTMPILTNILVQSVASDLISIKATDLDISMEGQYEVDVRQAGGFCLSAAKFLDVVRTLPSGNVTVKLNKETNRAEIRGEKNAFFKLFTVPVEDFPTLPTTEEVPLTDIDPDLLFKAMTFVLPASGTDDPRVYLNSIYLENRGKGLARFVATDGHKLSVIEKNLNAEVPVTKGVIIPRKAVVEMIKLMEGDALKNVKLGFANNHGFLKADRLTFSFRLIDSSYPNYDMVIPSNFQRTVRVNRAELKELVGRISVLAPERNSRVRMDFKQDHILASYSNQEYGSSQQPLEAQLEGEPVSLGFTVNILQDILGIFDQDVVTLSIVDPETPVKVEGEGFTEGLGVVMPIRLEYINEEVE